MKKTQAQLDQELKDLKEKHNVVYNLTVPINDEETEHATIFLRKLDRPVFKVVQGLIQKDTSMAIEALIKGLYIGGDDKELILNDFDALRSAEDALIDMIKAKKGELKKN